MPAVSEIIARGIARAFETPIGRAMKQTPEELAAAVRPVTQNVPEAPFAGTPGRQEAIRATRAPEPKTVWDYIQDAKTAIGSAFTAEPNTTAYIKGLFHTARMKAGGAQIAADTLLNERVVSHLQGDKHTVRTKGRILSDYQVQADDYATLKSKIEKDPDGAHVGLGGATIDVVERDLYATAQQAQAHPDIIMANQSLRAISDEAWEVMRAHGYVTFEQYREAYTPVQKLDATVRALGRARGEEPGGVLDQMRHRDATGQLRETSVLKVWRTTLANLYEKIAEDELAIRIRSDPSLNRAAQFPEGTPAPAGWDRYQPQPGLPGWAGTPEQEALSGLMDGLEPHRGWVIPEDLANRLRTFRRSRPANDVEKTVYKGASNMWRWLTVGNPANLGLNIPSDAMTALIGMPGERSHVWGTLQLMPGSYLSALRGSFGHETPEYTKAVKAGLTEASFVESMMGEHIPDRLANAAGEQQMDRSAYMGFMRKLRRGFEAGPRMAAARDAEKRGIASGMTPEIGAQEYARVGQAITGDFGAGAPALTRTPLATFAAPFLRFTGFATERLAKLLLMKGSRRRAWITVIGVPFAAMMWNHKDPEFEKAEYQIPAYDRDSLHFLRSNADGSLYRNENGLPEAIRFRYFLPEAVASTFGVGNLPSRVVEMMQGRKNLGDFAKDTFTGARQGLGGQLVPAQVAAELTSGRNLLTGEEQDPVDALRRMVPVLEQTNKVARSFEGGDLGKAARTAFSEYSGLKPTGMSRSDADLRDIGFKIRDTESRLRSARRKGDEAAINDLTDARLKLLNRVRAINLARRNARPN